MPALRRWHSGPGHGVRRHRARSGASVHRISCSIVGDDVANRPALKDLAAPHDDAAVAELPQHVETVTCEDEDTRALGNLFSIQEEDLVWIAGSTQAPEEEIVIDLYRRINKEFPKLRLFVVPRQKERFNEVAAGLRHSAVGHLGRPVCARTGPGGSPAAAPGTEAWPAATASP